MKNYTFDHVASCLDSANLNYGILPLHNGVRLIILERGGHVLGPFLNEETPALFWMNTAWQDRDTFRAFVEAGEWNIGGERVWIAPEIQYGVRDRADFMGSLQLPPQMSPGNFTLIQIDATTWQLHNHLTLEAYNVAHGSKTLDLTMHTQPVDDPLRGISTYAALLNGVIYAGYEQMITLTEHETNNILSETWNLIQLNHGGQLTIPASSHAEAVDYGRGLLPDDAQTVCDGAFRVNLTGEHTYKVGYKSAHITGRMAYYHPLDDERAYLLIRSFTNNPSSIYVEEPADQPGVIGDAVHIYSDNGSFGDFGEIECQGQTIGGTTGQSTVTDRFILWCYVGSPEKLHLIAEHLLGVRI